jgi:tetratricopeptide (TPR) repeat protein
VIYADNAESLQSDPRNADPAALGSWKLPAEPWWHALEQLGEEGDEPILLSTRYLWRNLGERAWIGVGPMGRADCLRMIDSLPFLGKLPLEIRIRLAERIDGHPRTVMYLDRLIAQRRRELGQKRIRDAWRDLIEPVLPEQVEQITADLLLEEIWKSLTRTGRAHARRLSILVAAAPAFVIDQLGRARDELIRAGILTRFRQQVEVVDGSAWFNRWGLHSLVKEHIARKTRGVQRRAAHRAAGEAYELRTDAPDATRAEQMEGIYHLQAVGENERSWPMVLDLVLWMRYRGMYQEAREELEGFTHKPVKGEPMAIALLLLCDIRQRQGESGPALLKLLGRARKLSSNESTHALLLGVRGSLLMIQARYEEAETSLRQAAAILERIVGRDNPDTLFAFSTLAEVLDRRGRLEEAERLLTEIVHAWERTDPGHPERAAALKALAEALVAQGRYGEAEACLRKAMALQNETLVEDHPTSTATLHTLAETMILQDRSEEAEALLRTILAQEERLQRTSHPNYAMTLVVLGHLLVEECRPEEAEALLRKALALTERTRGKNHPYIADILHPLAFILYDRSELQKADELLGRAVALSDMGGAAHPNRGALLITLAQVREEQGQTREAEELLLQALELTRQDPHGQAQVLSSRSQLLKRQGRFSEAESCLREALAIAEAPLGRGHWFYLKMMQDLAVLVDAQGRSEDSQALVEKIQRFEDGST